MDIKLNKEQQQIIFAAVLMTGVFSYGYWTYFWSRIDKKISEVTKKIEKSDHEIEQAERQVRRLPQFQAQIVELKARAEAGERKLPQTKGLPEMLDILSELARQHNIQIVRFNPSGVATRNNISELSYQLSIRGSYHSVAKFLTALALQERIFHARNLVLTPLSGAGQTETVAGQFTLVTFQYKG